MAGLLVCAAGLGLGAETVQGRLAWLLVPSAIVLGAAYGLCLVAGLVEVQRLAGRGALAGLTAVYYALTYLGFAAPYLLAVAAHLVSYTVLLTIAAGLALATALFISRRSAPAPHASAPHNPATEQHLPGQAVPHAHRFVRYPGLAFTTEFVGEWRRQA